MHRLIQIGWKTCCLLVSVSITLFMRTIKITLFSTIFTNTFLSFICTIQYILTFVNDRVLNIKKNYNNQ